MHSSRIPTARGSSRPRGVCLSTCWDTPRQLWAGDPPRCGPGDPPGCGAGDPLLQGMMGYHLQCMLGYPPPPPYEQND